MFDFFTESVGAGGGNGVSAGLFIPLADLPGMTLAEIQTTGTTREGHTVYALLNSIYETLSLVPSLGLVNLIKSSPVGTGPNRFTEGVGLTMQYLVNLGDRQIAPIPLPLIGSEQGIGAVYAEDIWPQASLVGAGGAISGAGILIPHDWIAEYGAETLSALDSDCRGWLGALFVGLCAEITPRSTTTSAAIVTRTNTATSRFSGFAIPPAWYDATNPVTGIVAADLSKIRIIQEVYLIEYELVSDPDAQTLTLSVRTA